MRRDDMPTVVQGGVIERAVRRGADPVALLIATRSYAPCESPQASSGSAVLGAAFPTSHDCPPPGTVANDIGALAVPIAFTTGTSTKTSYSTGAGSGKSNVFCTFCKNAVNGFANPPAPCSCDNGSSCGGFGPCPSSSFASCEQNQNGAFAHADATMIEEDGVAAVTSRPAR